MASHLQWVKQIARVQVENGGMMGLSRLLMQKIEKTVVVTSDQGHVLSRHIWDNQPVVIQERLSLPQSVAASTEMTRGISTFGGHKCAYYCWPIVNQKKEGYLWILTEKENLSAEEMENAEYLRSALLVEIVKKQEQLKLKQYLRDGSILNLLFNNSDQLETMGQVWGRNLLITHIVMILEGQTKVPDHGLTEVRTKAENFLEAKYPGTVTGMIGKHLVVLFPYEKKTREKDGQTNDNWKNIPRQAYSELQEILDDVKLWASVGSIYPDQPLLYRSYQEAKVALEMGKVLGKKEKLTFFNELGAIRLFYNQRKQDLRDFFEETLGPVLKYDRTNDGNLLLTLWHYYASGGDISAATKGMFIHANTLRYRLRKVEELTASSLDDQEVRFNIYAALKVGLMLGIFEV